MPEEVVIMVLGICTLGALLILVPFLLMHQRKMAEILHRRSNVADDLSNRVDQLTDAVYQLSARLDERAYLPKPLPIDAILLDREG